MAAEYLRVKTEMSELRKYKTELTEKIKQNQELENLSTPTHEDNVQFTQLNSEKVNQNSEKTWNIAKLDSGLDESPTVMVGETKNNNPHKMTMSL